MLALRDHSLIKHNFKNVSTESVKMDTGIPLFFSEIEYLLLKTIPLETIMRVFNLFVTEVELLFFTLMKKKKRKIGLVIKPGVCRLTRSTPQSASSDGRRT